MQSEHGAPRPLGRGAGRAKWAEPREVVTHQLRRRFHTRRERRPVRVGDHPAQHPLGHGGDLGRSRQRPPVAGAARGLAEQTAPPIAPGHDEPVQHVDLHRIESRGDLVEGQPATPVSILVGHQVGGVAAVPEQQLGEMDHGPVVVVAPRTGPVDAFHEPEPRAAQLMPRAAQSLLIDIARAGERLVAVGERGHVLYSDDSGQRWIQAPVPVSVMLTAVWFLDAQHGWAVGHDGMIIATDDGGASWRPDRRRCRKS